jgi:hypothetical protein
LINRQLALKVIVFSYNSYKTTGLFTKSFIEFYIKKLTGDPGEFCKGENIVRYNKKRILPGEDDVHTFSSGHLMGFSAIFSTRFPPSRVFMNFCNTSAALSV